MDRQQSDSPLDRTSGPLDRIERRVEKGESKRPFRNALEEATDQIPSGPLGKGGEGDVIGAAGYVAIKTGQLAVLPIPGAKQPGFQFISHGVEDKGNYEEHTIRVNAYSRSIAQFAAEYEAAAPSNLDFISSEVDTIEITEITERTTSSTWEVVVEVADRGQAES